MKSSGKRSRLRVTAWQPEGDLFEVGVGLGDGSDHLEAFVFTHRIRF